MSSIMLNLGTSGLLAQSRKLAVIGNNIANNTTTGYKKTNLTFAEAFTFNGQRQTNGLQNHQGQGVVVKGTTSDWTTGSTVSTGSQTNIAIVGEGLLPVTYNGETMYTRSGDFSFFEQLAPVLAPPTPGEYVLMRPNGAVLQDNAGASLVVASSSGGMPAFIEIKPDGTIYVDNNPTAHTQTLGLQRFGNPDALLHLDGGMYQNATPEVVMRTTTPETPGSGNGIGYLQQGFLEQSNVDLTREFTDMIAAQRAFQANAKTVTTADQMLQEVLNLKR